MALRVRVNDDPGLSRGYSVERLADGLFYDFADGTFKATPGTPIAALPEGTGRYAGRYAATLSSTPLAQWHDGNYSVPIHDTSGPGANKAIGELAVLMLGGDDNWAFELGLNFRQMFIVMFHAVVASLDESVNGKTTGNPPTIGAASASGKRFDSLNGAAGRTTTVYPPTS